MAKNMTTAELNEFRRGGVIAGAITIDVVCDCHPIPEIYSSETFSGETFRYVRKIIRELTGCDANMARVVLDRAIRDGRCSDLRRRGGIIVRAHIW